MYLIFKASNFSLPAAVLVGTPLGHCRAWGWTTKILLDRQTHQVEPTRTGESEGVTLDGCWMLMGALWQQLPRDPDPAILRDIFKNKTEQDIIF